MAGRSLPRVPCVGAEPTAFERDVLRQLRAITTRLAQLQDLPDAVDALRDVVLSQAGDADPAEVQLLVGLVAHVQRLDPPTFTTAWVVKHATWHPELADLLAEADVAEASDMARVLRRLVRQQPVEHVQLQRLETRTADGRLWSIRVVDADQQHDRQPVRGYVP